MNEQDVRRRINAQLLNLGWRFGPDGNVTLEGDCKTPAQKKKLGRLRHDYALYQSNSTRPLAIIEAKGTDKNLDQALEQSLKYAKKIGAKFAFVSDSFVAKMKDIDGNTPTIDGEIIRDLLPEATLIKLTDNINLETEKPIIKTRDELIRIFSQAETLLRKDGIDVGMDSIYEFCTILFIKIMSETSDKIPNRYRFDSLTKHHGQDLYGHYLETIKEFKKHYDGIFREVKIKSPEILEEIVYRLKGISLSGVDFDIKGEAYEYFLQRYSSQNKSVLGQHFTPRHITDMMTLLLNPQVKEKTYDPFCGTGGMLLSCYKEMRRNINDESEIENLNQHSLHGTDISYGTSQIAKMNMVLVGDGHSNINRGNSLEADIDGCYNNVITNIPFNLRGGSNRQTAKDTNNNKACVKHCLKTIMQGGRACIIIPENMAYEKTYKDIREFIAQNSKIEAVIRLPPQTFTSYTTARTCILWLSGVWQNKSSDFIYIEVKNDGFSASRWREPEDGSDIPKILENKDDLSTIYDKRSFGDNHAFFESVSGLDGEGEHTLGELLDIKTEKQALVPNAYYSQPRLCSKTNTISRKGEKRLGKNIKADEKILIEPGDLVIGTLHTQSGNGLFAISDGEYIATSQIVAKIKTDLVSVEYLVFALQNILPKMKTSDLVGRETYKESDILSLRIPAEPKEFKKVEDLERTRTRALEQIEAIKSKYKW